MMYASVWYYRFLQLEIHDFFSLLHFVAVTVFAQSTAGLHIVFLRLSNAAWQLILYLVLCNSD